MPFVVVPSECSSAVKASRFVNCDFVIAFYGCNEMVEVLLALIFYAKVVHYEGELNRLCDVFA
jgi:hypothetical protein